MGVIMKKEFEFILKESDLKYQPQGAGEFIKAKKLLLKAPTMRQERTADILSQCLMQAFKSNLDIANVSRETNQKQSETKDTQYGNEISSKDIKTMLFMSSKNISEVKEALRELLFDGTCLIDGVLPMRADHYQHMAYVEANELMGEYIANFLLSSLLSEKN